MKNTARIFNCARCRRQTLICTYCDRGNIYCGSGCARQSRIQNHRIANQVYQKTYQGRQKHAVRQRNYRLRQKQKIKKVTDQGSALVPPNDLLHPDKNTDKKTVSESLHCHFCGKGVSPYLRNGYLRHHVRYKANNVLRINDTG